MTKKHPSPFKDCTKCGEPVHARSAACKACGGPSPWKAEAVTEPPPNEPGHPPAGADATPDPALTLAPITQADVPALRAVESEPIDLNPSAADVGDFIQGQRATAADRDDGNGPHVFMERFSTMVGPVMAHFKANQVVDDFVLLQALKAVNAPMVPVNNAPGMGCCPKCRTVFVLPRPVPAKRAG